MRFATADIAARFDRLSDARSRISGLKLLNAPTAEEADIFALALLDPRLPSEGRDDGGIRRAFPELLARIGHESISLAMLQHAYEVIGTRSAGEQNLWFQSQRQYDPAADVARATGADNLVIAPAVDEDGLGRRVRSEVGQRVAGALTLTRQYNALRHVVGAVIAARARDVDPIASYKTALQEFLAARKSRSPIYSLVATMGPPHRRVFEAAVDVGRHRATGKGASKKAAEEAAAKAFLEEHAAAHLSAVRRTRVAKPSTDRKMPTLHTRADLRALLELFDLRDADFNLISWSLTHAGYEHRGAAAIGARQTALAQVGAQLLSLLSIYFVLDQIGDDLDDLDSGKLEEMTLPLRETAVAERAFEEAGLQRLFLRGASPGLTAGMKANAFQALLGAMLIAQGDPEAVYDALPEQVTAVYGEAAARSTDARQRAETNPKTLFQELTAPFGIRASYDVRPEGPPHARTFTAYVTLEDGSGNSFRFGKGNGRSRRAAEKDLARKAIRLLGIAHSQLGERDVAQMSVGLRRASQFFLRAQLTALASSSSSGAALLRYREWDLGHVRSLIEGDVRGFLRWVDGCRAVFAQDGLRIPEAPDLFYAAAGKTAPAGEFTPLRTSIRTVTDEVASLDPRRPIRIQDQEVFRNILAVTSLARLLGAPRAVSTLAEIVRDANLPGDRVTSIDVIGGTRIRGRRGAITEMLKMVVDAVAPSRLGIRCECDERSRTTRWEFEVVADYDVQQVVRELSDKPLWLFLEADLPILKLEARLSSVIVECGWLSGRVAASAPFEIRALHAFWDGTRGASAATAEVTARLAHNLKNELVAFGVASTGVTDSNRTAALRAQFDASSHLDAAAALCAALGTVGESLAPINPAPIEVDGFFRQYVADNLPRVPAGISLIVGSSATDFTLITDRAFLRAILDNLLRNAVEAMPHGGEVRFDWQPGPAGTLLVTVADTGEGMDAEMLRLALRGTPTSRKRTGSGVGMITVRGMLRRLGGSITGESERGSGTCWSLKIPTLNDVTTRSADDEHESSHT